MIHTVAVRFTSLYPKPGQLALDELREELEFPTLDERPYTIANFVSSADGRAALSGRSAPLSDDGDRAIFHALREGVDAIVVGCGTLGIERYGKLIRDQEAIQRRVERGLEPQPLACVVTGSGVLPDVPLLAEERVVAVSPRPVKGIKTVPLEQGELPLTAALGRLRADYGVRSLLCEGGPTLFGSMIHEGLVNELFLTLAPKLAGGGTEPTIASGAELAQPATLGLRTVHERSGSLFLRFVVSSQSD